VLVVAFAMSSPAEPRKSHYQLEGYLSPLKILDPTSELHTRIHDGFGQLDSEESLQEGLANKETRAAKYQSLIDRHLDKAWMWELATAPAILDIVESLIGPDIMCMATHIFVKHPPGAAEENQSLFVDWHQDVKYWGLDNAEDVVTAWYAIDLSSPINGCLQVVPRSHRDLKEHGTSRVEGNLLASNQAIALDDAALKSVVNLELQPGEMSVHHGCLIHGSCPNLSDLRRCGVTLRYMPPNVRQVAETNNKGKRWQAICVRGSDRFKHFGDMPAPSFPSDSCLERDAKRAKH